MITMSEDSLKQIGPYTIVEMLAETTNSKIYKAINHAIEREVAIKVLQPVQYPFEDPIKRLSYEAKAVNLVRHPGVVQIFDVGQTSSGLCFIIMEYIKGKSLAQSLKIHGVATAESTLAFLSDASFIFSKIHKAHVIHRDVKPSNIMITEEADGNRIRVIDFGIAKIPRTKQEHGSTTTGYLMGSEGYLSPEQALDASKVTDKTDVYSLGVVIYEMLTEQKPKPDYIYNKAPKALLEIVKTVSSEFSDLVNKMLSLKPEDRPSMEQIREQCERITRSNLGSKSAVTKVAVSEVEAVSSIRSRIANIPQNEQKLVRLIWLAPGSSIDTSTGPCEIHIEHDVVTFKRQYDTLYLPIPFISACYKVGALWTFYYRGIAYSDPNKIGAGISLVIKT